MKANFANKKVAVILGFYNGNNYIEAQIESILNQNFKNIDIFIFDDNSKKKLESKKLKIYIKKCKIKIIQRKTNLGYAKGNNLGLSKVKSDYTLILNPDASLKKNTLEKFPGTISFSFSANSIEITELLSLNRC